MQHAIALYKLVTHELNIYLVYMFLPFFIMIWFIAIGTSKIEK